MSEKMTPKQSKYTRFMTKINKQLSEFTGSNPDDMLNILSTLFLSIVVVAVHSGMINESQVDDIIELYAKKMKEKFKINQAIIRRAIH